MTKSANIYSLPITLKPIKAISDVRSHTGLNEHAIDFTIPEGTPIVATASGKIIYIKVDSNEGGYISKYNDFKFYNHIIIKHTKGEYTEYGHLKHLGTSKKIGDRVKKGEIIGMSGNTGHSTEPHLHFAVFILKKMKEDFEILPSDKEYILDDSDLGFQTVDPKFKEKIKVLRN